MSLLTSMRSTPFIQSSVASTSRCYAAAKAKAAPKVRQPTNQNRGRYPGGSKKGPTRPKSAGLWIPLTRNLTHPLFEEQHRSKPQHENVKLRLGTLTEQNIGETRVYDKGDGTVVKAYGVPRNLLVEFRLQSTPASIVREVTLQVHSLLSGAPTASGSNRHLLVGEAGSGKSHLLLQALALAQSSKNWIVLSFPRSRKLIDGTTQYVYDARTQTYIQPAFASETLLRIKAANKTALETAKTSREWSFSKAGADASGENAVVSKSSSLADLLAVGTARESGLGPAVLEALFEELGNQSEYRILLAVDEMEALYTDSQYKSTTFETIQAYHLSMPRLLLEYISGRKSFSNGLVLAATSSHTGANAPNDLYRLFTLPSDKPVNPYAAPSDSLVEFSKGLAHIKVPKLTLREAAGVFEYWRNERVVGIKTESATDSALVFVPTSETASSSSTGNAGDQRFLGTYAESGGVARDFVWKGLLKSLAL